MDPLSTTRDVITILVLSVLVRSELLLLIRSWQRWTHAFSHDATTHGWTRSMVGLVVPHGWAWAVVRLIVGSFYCLRHVLWLVLLRHRAIWGAESATICCTISKLWVEILTLVFDVRRCTDFSRTHFVEFLVLEHGSHSSWVSTMLMRAFVCNSRYLSGLNFWLLVVFHLPLGVQICKTYLTLHLLLISSYGLGCISLGLGSVGAGWV